MTYEEKREIRLQISQLLADAGLNQGKIKEIVEEEIKNKVDRAIDQSIKNLDVQCSSGNYIKEVILKILSSYRMERLMEDMVKEELKNRVVKVMMKDVEATK